MRIKDVKDRVGPVSLGLVQLSSNLLPSGGGEDGYLLPGHGLAPLLHGDGGQSRDIRQGLLPLHGRGSQHLE